MHDESRFERRGCHAERVAGFAGAFEPMHQDHFTLRERILTCAIVICVIVLGAPGIGMLHTNQHAHSGLRFVMRVRHRPATFELGPLPEIAGDGRKMGVAEQRIKRTHRIFDLTTSNFQFTCSRQFYVQPVAACEPRSAFR